MILYKLVINKSINPLFPKHIVVIVDKSEWWPRHTEVKENIYLKYVAFV